MYSPLDDAKLHDLVVSLYSMNWEASIPRVREQVDVFKAISVCEVLIATEGWRERVVAAKIISAFGLTELVVPLVKTFSANPEMHTARAYAKLVASTAPSNRRGSLLEELCSACPDSPYGKNMIKAITSSSTET